MKEVVILLEQKIQIKSELISRMERDLAIAKSIMDNDLRTLVNILQKNYPQLTQVPLSEQSD